MTQITKVWTIFLIQKEPKKYKCYSVCLSFCAIMLQSSYKVFLRVPRGSQSSPKALGPTKGRVKVKVKVRTWSGHGQVMVRAGLTENLTPTQKWDLSYTLKLVFTTHPLTHSPPPPSLNECLVNFVTLCDTL